MFKIITKSRYEELLYIESIIDEAMDEAIEEMEEEAKETTYHCGAKSCQFQTTSPNGLSIHRAKAHK